MRFATKTAALFIVAGRLVSKASADVCIAPCDDGVCTYTAKVDLYASELGYYTFDECGDTVNPTIGMVVGQTYKFVQTDRTNYYHPLGFAYFPDGAHDEKDELEPSIVPPGSNSACDTNHTCPAPMYFENGSYLGSYSNIETIANKTTGEDNFGLDEYEPKFFHPFGDWNGYGDYEIYLKFDVEDFDRDLFYFCHIHQFMSGRIKLLNDTNDPISNVDLPLLGYDYDTVSDYDKECGTYNTTDYQLPHDECPDTFVCGVAEGRRRATTFNAFAGCIDAMNCHMMASMTTESVEDEIALFIHNMIPHHQNAVNMAKALMKTGTVQCPDPTVESDGCTMEIILREIINGQNAQIQAMRGVLESMNQPEHSDCVVEVYGAGDINQNTSGAPSGNSVLWLALLSAISVVFVAFS